MNKKNLEITQTAMLFAIALVLMVLEGMIPPIPTLPLGIKLGLSNIVVMYALFFLGKRQAFSILVLKSLFVFLTRGAVAFAMSFCGGIFSLFILVLFFRLKKFEISYIMASVCASIAHNIGQLLISSLILKTSAVFYYLPILLISGVIMGIVTGVSLKVLVPAIGRVKLFNKN